MSDPYEGNPMNDPYEALNYRLASDETCLTEEECEAIDREREEELEKVLEAARRSKRNDSLLFQELRKARVL